MEREKTLVVFKPDSVQRGLVGDILSRFEKAGLKIVAMKMVEPDEEHFHKHYEEISGLITRWGQEIFDVTLKQMQDSPIIAVVFEGVDAVAHVRKMVGTLDPKESMPGTIRGDYTHLSREYTNKEGRTLPNIVHASGNVEEANKEIALWFEDIEVYEYKASQEEIIKGFKPKNSNNK